MQDQQTWLDLFMTLSDFLVSLNILVSISAHSSHLCFFTMVKSFPAALSPTARNPTEAELTSDKNNVETKLAAVNEDLNKIEDECISKSETCEMVAKRRRLADELALRFETRFSGVAPGTPDDVAPGTHDDTRVRLSL